MALIRSRRSDVMIRPDPRGRAIVWYGCKPPLADDVCDDGTIPGDRWPVGEWTMVAVRCADGVLRWKPVKFLE